MTRFFLGLTDINGIEEWFAVRPLIPLLAALPSTFLWMPAAYGVLNSILWLLSSLLMYNITLRVTGSRQSGLAAALMFATSPPTLLFFGSVMLEAGGTFFALLILWSYLRLQSKLNKPVSLLIAGVLGIGVLARETTLPVILTILLLGHVMARVKWTLLWVVILSIPTIIWQSYSTLTYGENYLTHYIKAGLGYSIGHYKTIFYADLADISKALALAHFPLATIALITGFFTIADRKQNLIFYSLLLPALIAYFLWPFRDLRIGVVTYYATMPLAGVGLEYIIKSLKQKPLFSMLDHKILWISLIAIHIVVSTMYVYNALGTFSPPWKIYLHSPGSLQAELQNNNTLP
jgi:4-amino-4-deoxy-L-arabinose transferase-like glycosyltransferase